MKRVLVLVALFWPVGAAAQPLDDGAVTAALQAGVTKKYSQLIDTCVATPGFGSGLGSRMAGGVQPIGPFDVVTTTAAGRIAVLAADAKRLYKTFSAADVTPEMRDTSTVVVMVNPQNPKRDDKVYLVPSPIERVVLKSKTDPNRVAQPKDFQTTQQEWSNLLGGKVQGNSAVASFSLAEIRELPPGDVDIVVVTQAGERRCKLGDKDRARLFSK